MEEASPGPGRRLSLVRSAHPAREAPTCALITPQKSPSKTSNFPTSCASKDDATLEEAVRRVRLEHTLDAAIATDR
jgi:hypothetical protein